MPDELVNATWQGPFDAQLIDGRTIQPGDQALVTEADLQSAHWHATDNQPQPAAPAFSLPTGPPSFAASNADEHDGEETD